MSDRLRYHNRFLLALLALAFIALPVHAENPAQPLSPLRLYNAIDRPIPIRIDAPAGTTLTLRLIDPVSSETVASTETESGEHDLAQLFPALWSDPAPPLLLLQVEFNAVAQSPPLVLQPLLTPVRHQSEWTARAVDAIERRDVERINTLLVLTAAACDRIRERVVAHPPPERIRSGLRIYPARTVTLRTDLGDIRLRLYPEHAPETVFRFIQLVEGGFYDTLTFHRVVTTDYKGEPFLLQTGDPTGTGHAGAGHWYDFESNTLPHTFGTASVARQRNDPNTNAGQFFICLSRDGCHHLDGSNTPFARVIDGADTLRAIALKPTINRDPDDPTSPLDKPIEPVVIDDAFTEPSPPLSELPSPLTEDDAYPRER